MNAPATLGIVTAGPVAAAVVARDDIYAVSTPSQALDGLLHCVKTVLHHAKLDLVAIERIAVCVGPGSFTGLRIGVAFAKSLCQARDLPIVGVSSYDIAEYGASDATLPSAAVVEGKRGFYYARIRNAGDDRVAFVAGDRDLIERSAAGGALHRLSSLPADEQARRAARIGRDATTIDWRHVMIDYGQRPNAVIAWEAQHGAGERGAAANASNQTGA